MTVRPTSRSWASTSAGAGVNEALRHITVEAIMTPAQDFMTCRTGDLLREAKAAAGDIDHLPVVDASGQLAGVVDVRAVRTHRPAATVDEAWEPLDTHLEIAAEAPLVEFAADCATKPFRFVVHDDAIVGLATLSDLQRLPARIALYGLVMGVELAMAELIRRQAALRESVADARTRDARIDQLHYTSFADKTWILERARAIKLTKSSRGRIADLRNKLAHSADYADTADRAREAAKAIADLLALKDILLRP